MLGMGIPLHPSVVRLLERDEIEQHSDEWYRVRETMLTASDFPTCLKQNPYKSRKALLRQKLGDKRYQFSGNEATQWGNMMEDVCAAIYARKYKKNLLWWGLTKHLEIDWLGGSPDRITEDGILLEIKCPLRREIKDEVPKHYLAQIQGLLHILDLEACDFVQYRPEQTWNPEEFQVTRIDRDPNWLRLYLPEMRTFREEWMHELAIKAEKESRGESVDSDSDEKIKKVNTRKPRKPREVVRERYTFWEPYPLHQAPTYSLSLRRFDSTPITEVTGEADEFFRFDHF